ncbi:MAG: hypothetical protein OEM97_05225 [Acidimicrobiia bacterium]|nr:hypothetical protein [Acidimicrobiia bacterium]
MDDGIRIDWYDLEDTDRDSYLDWLHLTHIPEVVARPGVAWAAHYEIERTHDMMKRLTGYVGRPDESEDIPTGSQYAFLVGAASPHVFFMPGYDDIDEANPRTVDMRRLRAGTKTVVTTEQARVNGPEFATRPPGATPGPFIQLGHFRVRSIEEEFDLSSWYANYRLPTITAMTGAIAARKLVTVAGWVKHVILYEFVSRDAHEEHFMGHEALAFSDGEWTNRVVTYTQHAPGSPSIAARIWPLVTARESAIISETL